MRRSQRNGERRGILGNLLRFALRRFSKTGKFRNFPAIVTGSIRKLLIVKQLPPALNRAMDKTDRLYDSRRRGAPGRLGAQHFSFGLAWSLGIGETNSFAPTLFVPRRAARAANLWVALNAIDRQRSITRCDQAGVPLFGICIRLIPAARGQFVPIVPEHCPKSILASASDSSIPPSAFLCSA